MVHAYTLYHSARRSGCTRRWSPPQRQMPFAATVIGYFRLDSSSNSTISRSKWILEFLSCTKNWKKFDKNGFFSIFFEAGSTIAVVQRFSSRSWRARLNFKIVFRLQFRTRRIRFLCDPLTMVTYESRKVFARFWWISCASQEMIYDSRQQNVCVPVGVGGWMSFIKWWT